MKSLKSIMLGLAMLVVAVSANATGKTNSDKLTKTDVLNIYMNAAIHGKIGGLDKILSEDIQYTSIRGQRTNTIGKKQMLESFKAGENIEQECKYSTTTVEDNDDRMVVKAEMKYADYTSTQVITIVNKGYGWEIEKVDTSVA